MNTPINEAEKKAFFQYESAAQKYLDTFYIGRNHHIIRDADKLHDLTLDGKDRIEEKIRSAIRDDILIEIIQDLSTGDAGWFSKMRCDHLHYVMCKDVNTPIPQILYRIDWEKFKSWFLTTYLKNNSTIMAIPSLRGWGVTINIPVPIKAIPKNLITEYLIKSKE